MQLKQIFNKWFSIIHLFINLNFYNFFMKSVYLAGPILGKSYQRATGWRESAIRFLAHHGITGVSPMRTKNMLRNETFLKDGYDHPLICQKGIVTRDRFDCQNCDLVLVNLLGAERISIGTMVEYGWADAFRKPIVTVIEKEGNPHEHSFVRELSGYRVETLESGLNIAKAILS